MKRLFLILACAVVCTICGAANTLASNEPLKVGFIMVGPVNDMGWNWWQEQGRRYVDSKLSGRVQTAVAEKVPESAEAERVMEKMIAQGNRVIFMTSYGYMEPGLRVASRHPEVFFMQVGRPNKGFPKNVGSYIVDFPDPMYASGIVAARMTKSNEIGYELGHAVPLLIREVNAFTLGARSINPKVRVHVVWTNSWADPPTEAEAAKGLIDRGSDVIVSHFDSSLAAVRTADKNGVFSIGCNADLHGSSKGWIVGQYWDWGPLYLKIINSVLDNSWKSGEQRYGPGAGYVKLSVFGSVVPKTAREEALKAFEQIKRGELIVFSGPLNDRNVKQRLAAGKKMQDSALDTMDWFVAGVDGALPKK